MHNFVPEGNCSGMTPPQVRSTITTCLWCLGACALGVVGALVLLVLGSRPAAALPITTGTVTNLAKQPVATVTSIVQPSAPASHAPPSTSSAPAAPKVTTSKPAAPSAAVADVVSKPVAAITTVTKPHTTATANPPAHPTKSAPALAESLDTTVPLPVPAGRGGSTRLPSVAPDWRQPVLPDVSLPQLPVPALPLAPLPVPDVKVPAPQKLVSPARTVPALSLPSPSLPIDLPILGGGASAAKLPELQLPTVLPELHVGLPSVALPDVDLGGLLPALVPSVQLPIDLPSIDLPSIDLGGVDVGSHTVVTLPAIGGDSVGGGSIGPGLGGVLPHVPLPDVDLGGVAPPASPVEASTPESTGVHARGYSTPSHAGSEPVAQVPGAIPDTAASATTLPHERRTFEGEDAPAAMRAPFEAPASMPDGIPGPFAPVAPIAPAPAAPGSGDGPNRAPTFLFTFAVALAAIALAEELSRRLALRDHLPSSQFLTVLIERPG